MDLGIFHTLKIIFPHPALDLSVPWLYADVMILLSFHCVSLVLAGIYRVLAGV